MCPLDTSRRPPIVSWLLLVVLFASTSASFAGCATTRAGERASRMAADVALPPSQEEQLGEKFSKQVESEMKLHPNERVQDYVRDMGDRAVKAAGDRTPEAIEFDFHVVDAPDTINAFAGPGGQIYFYSGLLKKADSKAEVMAVMCHEVAHVTERHIAKQTVAAYGLQTLTAAALGKNPGVIGNLVATVAQQGYLLRYSRTQERDADDKGLAFMLDTSYDPEGFVAFFEKLEGGPSPPVFLSSHPAPGDRIASIRSRLAGETNLPTKWGREEHRAILKLLEERAGRSSPPSAAGAHVHEPILAHQGEAEMPLTRPVPSRGDLSPGGLIDPTERRAPDPPPEDR